MNAMIDYPPDATTGEPNECTPCATCDECDVCMGPCLAVSDDPPGARPSLGELNPYITIYITGCVRGGTAMVCGTLLGARFLSSRDAAAPVAWKKGQTDRCRCTSTENDETKR